MKRIAQRLVSDLRRHRDRDAVAWLLAAAGMFAVVFVLRRVALTPVDGGAVIYTLPVALLALRFGLRGGLAAAAFGTLLLVADPAAAEGLSVIGFGARIGVLFFVGSLVGWFIDREHRSQRAREHERARFLSFFELSQDMLCTVDSQGLFVDLNPAWQQALGYSAQELRAQPFIELVHPDDRERTTAETAAVLDGNPTIDFDNRYLANDGSVRSFRWSAVLGDNAMIYARATDITAKLEAETEVVKHAEAKVVAESEVVKRAQERAEELMQSDEDLSRSEGRGEHERARLLSFFELSQDMLCTVDAQGFFVDLNPAWQQALGYTGVQLRAQPFIELVHPGDRERTTAEVAAIFEGNVTVDFDNRFLANDGSVRCFRWSSVLGGDGMIYARATDVTAKLEAETEVVKRAEELKRSNDDLMQFAFIASHDLNEPLRTIGGFAQLLERRYEAEVDARGRDYIKRMVGGVTRMQALIADLLMFSRAGREETDPESLDSSALAEEVLADLHQAIVDRGAVVEVGKLPQLVVNRKDLQQVLQNLISNALKFANGKTTRIEISADRIAAGWSFAVADNGIGIDERQRERIFGAFERLHNRDEYAGTGIGLAICKRIIEHRGGQIGVESGLDGGSRFVFTVPDAEPARAASAA